MKTKYICELCGKEFDTAEKAMKCESQGVFNPDVYPIGLMYPYIHDDFVGIFSIATSEVFHNKHIGQLTTWACRTPNYPGDTLENSFCDGGLVRSAIADVEAWTKYHVMKKEYVGCPEFNRMVAYLKSKNITPSYYDENLNLIQL